MEEKQHYLFGMHPVTEAVMAGRKFEKVLFKQGLEGPQFRQLLELVQQNDIPYQFVPGEKMNYLVRGAHQGVIAYISQIDYVPFEEAVEMAMSRCENPLFLMLDGVSDVRNFGAIARSAECAGVSGIILPAKGGAAINADAIKTSAGALLRIPTCKVSNLKIPIYYMIEAGFQIIAATEKAEGYLYDVNLKKPTVIILGSEGKGISDAVLSLCTDAAKIPMMGEIGSLNVSVAAAIVMYEAVRQRKMW
ncbi:MAG: 23S rRNA (guanosine(2251)-2'-O)-methyltransferase RlmB [Bacteroidales bacterium]|nr:23S rRNA (guanosine(2251)-2'-O)-methyltransferase RlmB [Bacteroidales bacterium]MDD4670826.1 23S rRNA (guanosine(2251)-2'-O)-methyltransferase RlmB [Bacteroidales bacterium]